MERAIQELQILKSSGAEGQKQLVETLQLENKKLKEQLREKEKEQENASIHPSTASNHLALFEMLTGLKIQHVQKKVNGELYTCIISGQLASKWINNRNRLNDD
jgi:hypothetical protein